MENRHIATILKNDPNLAGFLAGVHDRSTAPQVVNWPCAIVLNTECAPITGHWVAIYISPEGKGEYFNSYGLAPEEYLDFLKRNTRAYTYNKQRIQGDLTITCGYYCTLFLLARAEGASMREFVAKFKPRDLAENDIKVTAVINDLFRKSYKVA